MDWTDNPYLADLGVWHIAGAFLAALIFGVTKSGLKGLGVIGIILMALIFGSKSSTGIVLPILMMGDVVAVLYYRRHIHWGYLFKLLPWVIVGVLFGVWIGKEMPEELFRTGMAIIILISVVILFYQERLNSEYIPDKLWFAGMMGFLAGVATMLGNLAGAFTNIYMLSMRVKKNDFIGTLAFLYFMVNIFKFPFHIFYWGTITSDSLQLNLMLAPAMLIGFVGGIQLVKWINNDLYRKVILILTAMGALLILLR